MHISIFDIFKIGIGPSSSHTVGPMKAAREFLLLLELQHLVGQTARIVVELYGSLALTGKGHGTDRAILLGLLGETPVSINPDSVTDQINKIIQAKTISLLEKQLVPFELENDLLFHTKEVLPLHTNGMQFSAFDAQQNLLLQKVYYSIGGGFIVSAEEFGKEPSTQIAVPFPFDTAAELLQHCEKNNLSIKNIMLDNEKVWRSENDINTGILNIAKVMQECIDRGCNTPGVLPGILKVKRRAPELYKKLKDKQTSQLEHQDIMNWLNLFAMAVNEENAAGSRVVTAPTNGAAGIIPAVLNYYKIFCKGTEQGVVDFLLTAAAIAILYKKGASISGAEVGCQGEVGVASSMAAGALTAVLNGTMAQVENAAEIAMEHHLGMTCDPVGGLVQIPCIERNAMGSVKAVNAARLALMEDGQHKVSLDKVIATMRQTGRDMMTIYKETSQGGLAVNVTEC